MTAETVELWGALYGLSFPSKHEKQEKHYVVPRSWSWEAQKAREILPFPSKLVLGSIKIKNDITFSIKTGLGEHKNKKNITFSIKFCIGDEKQRKYYLSQHTAKYPGEDT